jgi:Protein of unknown function (DUF4232)
MRCFAMYLTVAATVALAGCGSSKTGTTATTATTGAPVATVSPCATAQLAASLGQSNGAAGTIYYPLNLRNTSSSTCTIAGYAAVSFVAGADDHQVGQAAKQDPGSTGTVTLSPGQTASARLGIVAAGNFPLDCTMTPVTGLRVFPPGQSASLVIGHADTACANPKYTTLHVGPWANA